MRVLAAAAAHRPVHRVLHRAGPPLARDLPVPLRDRAAGARRRVGLRVASQFLSPVPGRLIGPFLGKLDYVTKGWSDVPGTRPDGNRAEAIRTTATTLTIRSASNRGNERHGVMLASLARGILRDNVPELATALVGQFSDPNPRVDRRARRYLRYAMSPSRRTPES